MDQERENSKIYMEMLQEINEGRRRRLERQHQKEYERQQRNVEELMGLKESQEKRFEEFLAGYFQSLATRNVLPIPSPIGSLCNDTPNLLY